MSGEKPEPWKLFRLRLSELHEDISKVQAVMSAAKGRSGTLLELEKLLEALDGALDEASQVSRNIKTVVLPTYRGELSDDLLDDRTVESEIAALRGYLRSEQDVALVPEIAALRKHLRSAALQRQEAAVMIESLKNRMVVPGSRAEQAVEDWLLRCTAVRTGLEELAAKTADSNFAAAEAWQCLTTLTTTCRPLFDEYMDLLSGLTLRDAMLDDRVGRLVDGLLDHLQVYGDLIVIPTAHRAVSDGLKAMLRLPFPEWTVWDVPRAAFEVGRARYAKPEVGPYFRLPGYTDAFAGELYAEIYATLMIGPAYACAATLLWLRPDRIEQIDGQPSDLDRAYVVLGALGRHNDLDFLGEVRKIRKLWEDAVRHSGHDPTPAASASLDSFVRKVFDTARSFSAPPIYRPAQWAEARRRALDWLTSLNGGTATDFQLTGSILDDLNAAWHIRLSDPEGEDAAGDDDSTPTPPSRQAARAILEGQYKAGTGGAENLPGSRSGARAVSGTATRVTGRSDTPAWGRR